MSKRRERSDEEENQDDVPTAQNLAYRLPGQSRTTNTLPRGTMVVWNPDQSEVDQLAIPTGRGKYAIVQVTQEKTGKPSQQFNEAVATDVTLEEFAAGLDTDQEARVSILDRRALRTASHVPPARIENASEPLSGSRLERIKAARAKKRSEEIKEPQQERAQKMSGVDTSKMTERERVRAMRSALNRAQRFSIKHVIDIHNRLGTEDAPNRADALGQMEEVRRRIKAGKRRMKVFEDMADEFMKFEFENETSGLIKLKRQVEQEMKDIKRARALHPIVQKALAEPGDEVKEVEEVPETDDDVHAFITEILQGIVESAEEEGEERAAQAQIEKTELETTAKDVPETLEHEKVYAPGEVTEPTQEERVQEKEAERDAEMDDVTVKPQELQDKAAETDAMMQEKSTLEGQTSSDPGPVPENVRRIEDEAHAAQEEIQAATVERLLENAIQRIIAQNSAEVKLSQGQLGGQTAPVDPNHRITNNISATVGIEAHENNKRRDQAEGGDGDVRMADELEDAPLSDQAKEQVHEPMDTGAETMAASANLMETAENSLKRKEPEVGVVSPPEEPATQVLRDDGLIEARANIDEMLRKRIKDAQAHETRGILGRAEQLANTTTRIKGAQTDDDLLRVLQEDVLPVEKTEQKVENTVNEIAAITRQRNVMAKADVLTEHGDVPEQVVSENLNPPAVTYMSPTDSIAAWRDRSRSRLAEMTAEQLQEHAQNLVPAWNTWRTEDTFAGVEEMSRMPTRLLTEPTSSVQAMSKPHANQSAETAAGQFIYWYSHHHMKQEDLDWEKVPEFGAALGLEMTDARLNWIATGNAKGDIVPGVVFKEEDLDPDAPSDGDPNSTNVLKALARQTPLPQERIPEANHSPNAAPTDMSQGPHKVTPSNVPTSSDRTGFVNNIPDPRFSERGGQFIPNVDIETTLNPDFDDTKPEGPDNRRLIHNVSEDRFAGAHDVMNRLLQAEADRLLKGKPFTMYAPIHSQPVDRFLGVKNYRRLGISIQDYIRDFSELSIVAEDVEQMYKWNAMVLALYGQYIYSFAGYSEMTRTVPVYTPKVPVGVQQEFMELQELMKEVKSYQLVAETRAERVADSAASQRPIEQHLDDFFKSQEQEQREKLFNANSLIIAVDPGTDLPEPEDPATDPEEPVKPPSSGLTMAKNRPSPYIGLGEPKKPMSFGVQGLKSPAMVGVQEIDRGIVNTKQLGTTASAQPIASEQFTRQQKINIGFEKSHASPAPTQRDMVPTKNRFDSLYRLVNGR